MSVANGPVLISDPLPPATEEILRNAGLEVIVGADKVEESLPNISGWILRSGTQITSELLDQAPNLKCICRAGAGVDNIDCDAAAEKGVLVMNTPAANSNAAAEHALALMFAVARSATLPSARRMYPLFPLRRMLFPMRTSSLFILLSMTTLAGWSMMTSSGSARRGFVSSTSVGVR